MPTKTFLNLPKERQETLIEAAKLEFSEHLLNEASINRIIQKIKMPRGTFYLYFKNKEELYFYILEKYANIALNKFKNCLQDHQGNLLESLTPFVTQIIYDLTQDKQKQFFKNIFLNMNYNIEHNMMNIERKSCHFDYITNMINKDLLNIKEEDLKDLYHIIIAITMHTLSGAIIKDIPPHEIMKHYQKQITILKEGLEKNRKE